VFDYSENVNVSEPVNLSKAFTFSVTDLYPTYLTANSYRQPLSRFVFVSVETLPGRRMSVWFRRLWI